MKLPEYVLYCVQALEAAGFAAYAVGGCVRDSLLGLTPHDYDLCTNALPEQIREVFKTHHLVLAGEKHGTVGVITHQGVVEITTFRTEGGYRDHRHPDWVKFVDQIDGDLARRDFTVNAMAWSPTRGFADPFGGREDLKNRILRAVGEPQIRFYEDALRILRGVRFAVRYRLTPDDATLNAMFSLAPLMDSLASERVLEELCKLLPLVTAEDLLQFSPALTQVLPELKDTLGFQQHSPHHAYDVFTHTAQVVAATPAELPLRWAALLHDIGKVPTFTQDQNGRGHFKGHAKISAQMADAALRRLKSPTALRERVVFLIDKHMTPLEPDKKLLRRRLSQYGEEALRQLLALQRADFCSKGVADPCPSVFDQIDALLGEILQENSCLKITDLAIDGHDLMQLGLAGQQIGETLEYLLCQVLDETTPNEKAALLQLVEQKFTHTEE